MYDLITNQFMQAQQKVAGIGKSSKKGEHNIDQRIMKTKREFEHLLKEYGREVHKKDAKSKQVQSMEEKRIRRELRQQQIKERKFMEDLQNQQKSLQYKRSAQQVRLGK